MPVSLPSDVLFITFRFASTINPPHDPICPPFCLPSALATYALVNKAWHDVAQHELYSRLYLRPSTHRDTLILLLRTLESTPALASLTYAISYAAYALGRGDTCTMARVLQLCSPRIQHVSLQGWNDAPDELSELNRALGSCTRLRTLTIANGASAAHLCAMPAFLATVQRWPHIEALSLGANCVQVPCSAVAFESAVARACPKLVRWEFRADAGTADADILPPACLAPRLSTLVLRGGALRMSEAFAPSLRTWAAHLTHLVVQFHIPDAQRPVPDEGLGRSLARFPRLRSLRIPSSYLRPCDLEGTKGFPALRELHYRLHAHELPLLSAALRDRGAFPMLATLTVLPMRGSGLGFEADMISDLVEVCGEKGVRLGMSGWERVFGMYSGVKLA